MKPSTKKTGQAPSKTSGSLRRLLPLVARRDPRASDRDLVEACLRGDERAWEALVDKYENLIFSIPIKYGGTREDAADIFQAVCLELFNELPRLRNSDNLRPWLMTVTAHQAFQWKRRRQRQALLEVAGVDELVLDEIPLPPAIALEVEREQLVREAVARLSRRCQEIIRMLFYEHPTWPYTRVAAEFGLATGSIGFIRGRCLKQLQRLLEELGF